jgi:hypothetical protein
MNIPNYSILDPIPSGPAGYITKDGMWAVVPSGNRFMILHNGQQIHLANNIETAKNYIKKQIKQNKNTTSTLESFL